MRGRILLHFTRLLCLLRLYLPPLRRGGLLLHLAWLCFAGLLLLLLLLWRRPLLNFTRLQSRMRLYLARLNLRGRPLCRLRTR